jgi:hypothetical protein
MGFLGVTSLLVMEVYVWRQSRKEIREGGAQRTLRGVRPIRSVTFCLEPPHW